MITFMFAVALHALWDGVTGRAAYFLLAAVSLGWLLVELHRSNTLTWDSPSGSVRRP